MQQGEIEKALELLRNQELGGIVDLTGINVQQLKNKKSRKVLGPYLKKYLPRRQKGIEHSSYYRELRLKILPLNPHFKKDVSDIRSLFHIPLGQINNLDLTKFPDRPEPWNKEDKLNDLTTAGWWYTMHICLTKGIPLDPSFPPFPKYLLKSALQNPFMNQDLPPWLKLDVNIPQMYETLFDQELPMDNCIMRLIARYQLPWRICNGLRVFILTQNIKYIKNFSPFDITIVPVERPIGRAFIITVDWLDEFTTEKQWSNIWQEIIVPRQKKLWEQRGNLPHSKQEEIYRIIRRIENEPWVLELYNQIQSQEIGIDAALKQLAEAGKLPSEDVDRSTAMRIVKRLDRLTKPLG